ncbi:MAG: iron chaperone [Fimbriimonadaceae bacterium]
MDTIDDYFDQFDGPTLDVLERLRALMREEVPEGVEAISYKIPTIRIPGLRRRSGNLVHFAAFKDHVSIYPRSRAVDEVMGDEVGPFASGSGTLLFRLDDDIPYDLIRRVVRVLYEEAVKTSQ